MNANLARSCLMSARYHLGKREFSPGISTFYYCGIYGEKSEHFPWIVKLTIPRGIFPVAYYDYTRRFSFPSVIFENLFLCRLPRVSNTPGIFISRNIVQKTYQDLIRSSMQTLARPCLILARPCLMLARSYAEGFSGLKKIL